MRHVPIFMGKECVELQNRALIYNKNVSDINSLNKKKLHAFLLIMTHFS